jgi:1,6-anhydro-N-acetylmuramate kinase
MASLPAGAPLLERWMSGSYACEFQIGESAIVAAATRVPTVSHFRANGRRARRHRSLGGGGGVRNRTLLGMLRDRLPATLSRQTSDVYGLPAQYQEAIKFGVLALAHQRKLANNIPAASGASAFAILGRAVRPPRIAVVNPELARH